MNQLPKISVVIATFNSSATIAGCLHSIRSQHYPKSHIEIILADGGSHDATKSIARSFGARIVSISSDKQGAEYNRAVGAHAAHHELLLFLDHDNLLPHNKWLQHMIEPLVNDSKIVGVETLHYTYSPTDSYLGRYFALFGANDIFAYYVGKADRLPHFYTTPQGYGAFAKAKVYDSGNYFTVDFSAHAIPTLGSNGFLVRKSILFSHALADPETFFHIDVNVDLIRKGFNRYAFIKDSLHHKSDERGIFDYLARRKLFMERYHFINHDRRRYSLYQRSDFYRTIRFIVISLTGVIPFVDAVRGYVKIHDAAWFLNPIMCVSIVLLYGFVIAKRSIISYANYIMGK